MAAFCKKIKKNQLYTAISKFFTGYSMETSLPLNRLVKIVKFPLPAFLFNQLCVIKDNVQKKEKNEEKADSKMTPVT